MTPYWELKALLILVAVACLWGVLLVLAAWWDDRRKWRAVPRHLGSTYDASVKPDYRPNIRLVRP